MESAMADVLLYYEWMKKSEHGPEPFSEAVLEALIAELVAHLATLNGVIALVP